MGLIFWRSKLRKLRKINSNTFFITTLCKINYNNVFIKTLSKINSNIFFYRNVM
jgi:hypothetical protein